MTYEQADTFLNKGRNKNHRTIAGPRSTEMVRRDNGIAIKYHATDVVTLHPNGSATLNSGGYRTMTTKGRINEYTLANIGQRLGLWYVRGGSLFYDGMTIRPDGTPVKPMQTGKTEAKKRKLDRMVSAYIRAFRSYVEENKSLPEISNGDCMYCHMIVTSPEPDKGKSWGEATGDVHHILLHLQEGYIMGSILWRSIQRCGNPRVVWEMAQSYARQGKFNIIDRDLRYYLRTLKPALLELM